MSKVVSFRASEELDEFLEQVAEDRMTTKSTAAQMLVAERVKQLQDDGDDDEPETNDTNDEDGGGNDLPPIFERHSDKWYRPDSTTDTEFAVECPDRRRYYKSQDGAEGRLRREFE